MLREKERQSRAMLREKERQSRAMLREKERQSRAKRFSSLVRSLTRFRIIYSNQIQRCQKIDNDLSNPVVFQITDTVNDHLCQYV